VAEVAVDNEDDGTDDISKWTGMKINDAARLGEGTVQWRGLLMHCKPFIWRTALNDDN